MESQDLDKLFRDAFEQAEETPSNRVWEGIEQKLAKEKKIIPFYIKHRKQLSIAASLVLFFGIGLTFYKQPIPTGREKIEDLLATIEKNNESSMTESTIIYEEQKKIEKELEESTNSQTSLVANKEDNQDFKTESNSINHVEHYVQSTNADIKLTLETLSLIEKDIEVKPNYTAEIKKIETLIESSNSFVFTETTEDVKSSIVTRLLNSITKNILSKSIDIHESKEIEFKNDDEGSLTLNIFNSLAKK